MISRRMRTRRKKPSKPSEICSNHSSRRSSDDVLRIGKRSVIAEDILLYATGSAAKSAEQADRRLQRYPALVPVQPKACAHQLAAIRDQNNDQRETYRTLAPLCLEY